MKYLSSPREVWFRASTAFLLSSGKDRNCEICQRTKTASARAEDAPAEPYLVQKILVIWLQQITKFSVKVVNLETIIDMQSWCRTWPLNGSKHFRAKQKHLRKHKGACNSSWSPIGSQKSFTLTIPWSLAKRVNIFCGIIVRRPLTVKKQMGCWENSTPN